MADDRPTISSGRLPANEIPQRDFGIVRRGFDPEEVRAFLQQVARELVTAERREQELLQELTAAEARARNPVIDEGVLTHALGQRSAAVLRNAHEEAARITQSAEESAVSVLREAQQHATEIQVGAESQSAERIAEAELEANALRQQARDEAAAMMEAARAEGEGLIERAREHGRAMVDQAQDARRRVLADMAHRRRLMTEQIEQFRAARDEIASSIVGVRHSVDRIVDDLARADDAARAAAADVARHVTIDAPEAVLVAEGERAAAELGADSGAALAAADDVVDRAMASSASLSASLRLDDIATVVERPGGGSDARRWSPPAERTAGNEASGGHRELSDAAVHSAPSRGTGSVRAAPRPAPLPDPAAPNPAAPDQADPAAGDPAAPNPAAGDPAAPNPAAGDPAAPNPAAGDPESDSGSGAMSHAMPQDPGGTPADVDGLFARLRARQETEVGRDGDASPGAGTSPGAGVARMGDDVEGPTPVGMGGASDASAGVDAGSAVAPADHGNEEEMPPASNGSVPVEATSDAAPNRKPAPTGEEAAIKEGADDAGQRVAVDPEPSVERAALERRSAALDPIVTAMARRLKRALQDDQNGLLDRLRQGPGTWSDDLLPAESTQRALYAKASASALRDSMAAGIAFARSMVGGRQGRAPNPDPRAIDAVTDELTSTVVTLLRRRLEGGDIPDAAERVGAAYREWRGERIERLAEDRAIEAFGAGVLVGSARGSGVVWMRGDSGPGCADCEDNALAGATAPGEQFPTGHRHPPAHAGCRCLVVPAPQ